MKFKNMFTGEEYMLKGSVFIGFDGRPYLRYNGWICWWHPDKNWVRLFKDDGRADAFTPLPPDQAALYGVEYHPPVEVMEEAKS